MLSSIELNIADRLARDATFRREWFRADLESSVPLQLKRLREFRRLTQTEVAAKAGVPQSSVSRFESSRENNWKIETLLRFADALDARVKVVIEKFEDAVREIATQEVSGFLAKASVLDAPRVEMRGGTAPLKSIFVQERGMHSKSTTVNAGM